MFDRVALGKVKAVGKARLHRFPQMPGQGRVQLDRVNAASRLQHGLRQGAESGTDFHHVITLLQSRQL